MDKLTEAQILRSLYNTYLGMSEGVAMGKAGTNSGDTNTKGAAARVSSGRGMTLTPARGLGRDKRHVNNPKGDDARIKTYKDQIKKDKEKDRGISSSDRKERARQNKENSSKAKLDDLLKDIRGK